MPKSLVNRIRLIYLPFDLIFGVLIPLAVVNGIEPADWTYALLVFYVLGIGRTLGNMIMIGRIFGPPAHWIAVAPARPDGREVRDADEALRSGPRKFTVGVMSLWAIQL